MTLIISIIYRLGAALAAFGCALIIYPYISGLCHAIFSEGIAALISLTMSIIMWGVSYRMFLKYFNGDHGE